MKSYAMFSTFRHACRVGRPLIICVFLCSLCVLQAEAGFLAQAVSGFADVADEGLEDWAPLEAESSFDAGQVVRTDFGALADLEGDDGSYLSINEATQVSLLEFDYQPDREIRIARFAILEGTITADAAHFDYATNIFEVETPTVVASFKFSKAKITVKNDGQTTIIPINGLFAFHQKSLDILTTITISIEGQEEITFSVPQGGDGIGATVDPETGDVGVENTSGEDIVIMVGGQPQVLRPGQTFGVPVVLPPSTPPSSSPPPSGKSDKSSSSGGKESSSTTGGGTQPLQGLAGSAGQGGGAGGGVGGGPTGGPPAAGTERTEAPETQQRTITIHLQEQ